MTEDEINNNSEANSVSKSVRDLALFSSIHIDSTDPADEGNYRPSLKSSFSLIDETTSAEVMLKYKVDSTFLDYQEGKPFNFVELSKIDGVDIDSVETDLGKSESKSGEIEAEVSNSENEELSVKIDMIIQAQTQITEKLKNEPSPKLVAGWKKFLTTKMNHVISLERRLSVVENLKSTSEEVFELLRSVVKQLKTMEKYIVGKSKTTPVDSGFVANFFQQSLNPPVDFISELKYKNGNFLYLLIVNYNCFMCGSNGASYSRMLFDRGRIGETLLWSSHSKGFNTSCLITIQDLLNHTSVDDFVRVQLAISDNEGCAVILFETNPQRILIGLNLFTTQLTKLTAIEDVQELEYNFLNGEVFGVGCWVPKCVELMEHCTESQGKGIMFIPGSCIVEGSGSMTRCTSVLLQQHGYKMVILRAQNSVLLHMKTVSDCMKRWPSLQNLHQTIDFQGFVDGCEMFDWSQEFQQKESVESGISYVCVCFEAPRHWSCGNNRWSLSWGVNHLLLHLTNRLYERRMAGNKQSLYYGCEKFKPEFTCRQQHPFMMFLHKAYEIKILDNVVWGFCRNGRLLPWQLPKELSTDIELLHVTSRKISNGTSENVTVLQCLRKTLKAETWFSQWRQKVLTPIDYSFRLQVCSHMVTVFLVGNYYQLLRLSFFFLLWGLFSFKNCRRKIYNSRIAGSVGFFGNQWWQIAYGVESKEHDQILKAQLE